MHTLTTNSPNPESYTDQFPVARTAGARQSPHGTIPRGNLQGRYSPEDSPPI